MRTIFPFPRLPVQGPPSELPDGNRNNIRASTGDRELYRNRITRRSAIRHLDADLVPTKPGARPEKEHGRGETADGYSGRNRSG
jgi:hypothetical protein